MRYSQAFLSLGKTVVNETIALDRQILSGQVKLWELKFEALKRLCLFHNLPYTSTKIAKQELKKRYDAIKNRKTPTPATPATPVAVATPATPATPVAVATPATPATPVAVATDPGDGWILKFYDLDNHKSFKESEGYITYLLYSNLVVFPPDPRKNEAVAIARFNPKTGTFRPLLLGDKWKQWGFLLKPYINDETLSSVKRQAKKDKEDQKMLDRAKSLALLKKM